MVQKILNVEKIREDFPILKRKVNGKPLIYLDNSATTQKPKQVIEAMTYYYENNNANVHRGIHKLSEESSELYEKAHQDVAKFISAKIEEISFTKNTTESLNALAYILIRNLKKGDEILISKMEHHSNIVPWQYLANEKGLKLNILDLTEDGRLDLNQLENSLSSKTKIVSLTLMSNVLGTINPIQEISKLVKDNGSYFIVDGAQGVPQMPINVNKLGCDFLAFSGHKMLGPTGIGVLYGKEKILKELDPFLFGGGMIREVKNNKSTWDELPWKMEAGTPNIAEAVGLSAAIKYLEKIGMNNIKEHEKNLVSYGLEKLNEIDNLKIYGPSKEHRGGVISFNIDKIHPHDLSTVLDHEGIAIRGGHHCAMLLMDILGVTGSSRASFYIYNTKEEIDKLVEGIQKARKLFD